MTEYYELFMHTHFSFILYILVSYYSICVLPELCPGRPHRIGRILLRTFISIDMRPGESILTVFLYEEAPVAN